MGLLALAPTLAMRTVNLSPLPYKSGKQQVFILLQRPVTLYYTLTTAIPPPASVFILAASSAISVRSGVGSSSLAISDPVLNSAEVRTQILTRPQIDISSTQVHGTAPLIRRLPYGADIRVVYWTLENFDVV